MKSTSVDTAFRMLFDAMADGMLLIDEQGQILLSNPALRSWLNYTEAELVGMTVEALLPTPHGVASQWLSYAHHATAGLIDNGRPLAVRCRDGRELPVDICLSPLSLNDQHCALVTLHDATLRRHAQTTLKASEERLKLAKHAASLGVYDCDLATGIVYCDEHVRLLWGFDRQEPITHEMLQEGIHPPDRVSHQAAWESALDPAGNGQYATEYRIINRSDCSMRWVSVIGQVFSDRHPCRLIGVVRDITEQKAQEQKIQQQRHEMEVLLKHQVAAQTISAIAHELNQPLVAISAYSEFALRLLRQGGSRYHPDLEHVLLCSVEQAQRAGQTLHELLAFLQEAKPKPAPMALNDCVMESIAALRRDGYGDFSTVLTLQADLPAVQGNRIQVQKVLVNLLRNSIEAMRAANLPAHAMRISVATARIADMAQVSVQDNGPGIGTETARRIFDPFYTTKSTGIGMGLAISRSLVESLGGRLWLDANSKIGCTFHFTLPLAS